MPLDSNSNLNSKALKNSLLKIYILWYQQPKNQLNIFLKKKIDLDITFLKSKDMIEVRAYLKWHYFKDLKTKLKDKVWKQSVTKRQ